MRSRFSLRLALGIAGAWVVVSPLAGQGDRTHRATALTLEHVAVATGVSQAAISPDGSQVVFVSEVGNDAELFIVPARGGYPLRLTYSAGSKSSPAWSPDGRRIAFLSGGEIWMLPADGGVAKQLTTGHRAESPVWSPRGDEIAFVSNLEGNQDIAAVPVEGGWPRRIIGGPLDETTPSWSPDGSRVAFIRRDAAWVTFQLWTAAAADGGGERKLFETDSMTTGMAMQWSPKSDDIAFVHNADGYDHIWIVSARGGSARQLTRGGGEDSTFRWSPDGTRIAYSTNLDHPARRTLRVVSVKDGAVVKLSATDGIDGNPTWSSDARTIAFLSSAYNRPPDVWTIPGTGGAATPITRSALAGHAFVEPRHVTYKSSDGLDIPAILYPSRHGDARRSPALIFLIGGPGGHNNFSWDPFKQYLAQQGYVVLAPNYRGSGGYGKKFESLNDFDSSRGEVKDIAAAAEYLKSLPSVDGARLGVWGGSHGGTLTMQSITRYPRLFRAAVNMYGVVNRETYVQRSDKLGRSYWLRFMGGPPPLSPELYDFSNTLQLVKELETPLLVLHGDADPRVPPFESRQLVDELKKFGKVHDAHFYPGEPHGFRKPENRIDAYTRIAAWFARYLYPDYEAPPRPTTSSAR
jgi:dipeptidyl aminopeptidase/acylaminoacyl peptidase